MIFNQLKYKLASSYISSTISLTLVLLVVGILFLSIFNGNSISKKTKESISLTVILNSSALEPEINDFINTLQLKDYTKSTDFVSKEHSAKILKEELGEDFETILEFNPLPNTIELKLIAEYTNLDSISTVEQEIRQNKIVEDIFYYKTLVDTIDKKMNVLSIILSFLALFVLIVASFLINNTIRLTFYSRRFTIKTMQLVGATNSFISKPFIMNSLIQGVVSSFLAISILIISILFLQKKISEFFVISHLGIVFFITFIFGIFITFISTYISLNKYLNSKSENLYY